MIENKTKTYTDFRDTDNSATVIRIEESINNDKQFFDSIFIDYNLYNTIEIVGIENIISFKKILDSAYSYLEKSGYVK